MFFGLGLRESPRPNKALQATAAALTVFGFDSVRSLWLQTQVRLPAAVPELGR